MSPYNAKYLRCAHSASVTAENLFKDNILGEQELNRYLNADDPAIKKALEIFKDKAAFPKIQEKDGENTRQVALKVNGDMPSSLRKHLTRYA